MTAQKSGEKFVVCHTRVDGWDAGTVITRDQLKTTAIIKSKEGDKEVEVDRHDRLLALGAIRPATAEEASQEKVTIGLGGAALTQEANQMLATKDAEIEHLRELVADQRAKASWAEQQKSPPAPAKPHHFDPVVESLAKEKDTEIEKLRSQLKDLEKASAPAPQTHEVRTQPVKK